MSLAASIGTAAPARDDVRVMGVVASAHFTSHVLQIALAPLFPLMRDDLGVGFTELGLILTMFYAASGLGQVVSGVLVDRFGAHRLLIAGVALQGSAVAGMAFAPQYWVFLPLALAAGLGNSVYHPADLSILSHRISPKRLGRAFAVHATAGSLGFALSPLIVGAIASTAGWRTGLFAAGAFGVVMAVWLVANRPRLVFTGHAGSPGATSHPSRSPAAFLHILAMPVVLLAFTYFVLTAFSGSGIQSFTIAALTEGYGAPLAAATVAVTAYQLGSAAGVLFGGVLADHTERHHRVAMAGLAVATVLTAMVANTGLPLVAVIALLAAAGFAVGATAPSRDVLVRRAAPASGLGKVFGIVYSGFDVGSLIGPLVYGALLDRGEPQVVFLAAALTFAVAIVTVLGVRTRVPSSA